LFLGLVTWQARAMTASSEDAGDVTLATDGAVLTITFARPAKRNALTQSMYRAVSDALEAADADLGIRAVVVTGTGVAFTAGNDLREFASGAGLEEVTRFIRTISSLSVPLIAAVNGIAVGIGLTMLLHCDLVYVEPTAMLSTPFVDLGLVPEAASSLLLARVIGARRASELLLVGRSIDGTEAAAWGLANAAVSPALQAAHQAAHHLAAKPPRSLRNAKALMRSDNETVSRRIDEELELFAEALGGAEFSEIMAARLGSGNPNVRP
jgi:enoyl-CoA hydratase/carnithine racemase